jgi:hypothetical protein
MVDYKKILIAVLDNFLYCEGTDHLNSGLTPLDGLTAADQEALLECQKSVRTNERKLKHG